MKKFKNILLLSLCGIIFLSLALGSSSETSEYSSSNGSSGDVKKFSYTVDKSYSDGYGMSYYIEGIVTNNTAKEYNYVQIEFICYDKDGNNLGTAIDNTNNLLGNQTWKYKAMFLGSNADEVDHCDYHETTSW